MPTLETERLILRDFVASDWAITLRSNGLLIGWLILGRSRHAREPGMHECGCGYALTQHYWGQGYMPEALRAVFTYAFTVLGTRLIHAECERENTASARVMQKCGMAYEGTMYDDDGLGNWAHRYRYVITAQTEKPLLVIGGEPASGKSLLMGELTLRYNELVKPHLDFQLPLISYDRVHYLF